MGAGVVGFRAGITGREIVCAVAGYRASGLGAVGVAGRRAFVGWVLECSGMVVVIFVAHTPPEYQAHVLSRRGGTCSPYERVHRNPQPPG